ncbi:MAG: ABC transporter permease, partial [Muribaculaceae bacterium]|nr:ABC transporter permease [Muribaculaceae bacterium]
YYPVRIQETETTGDVEQRLHGTYTATILVDDDNIEKVRDGIINMLNKESDGSDWTFELEDGMPASYLTQMLGGSSEAGIWGLLKDKMIILVVLLFVPAINLGGLISGRMDARTGELGVRKAFGANKKDVIWMIISENLVYTITGGIAGFMLSIILIWVWIRPVYNMLTTLVGNFQLPDGTSFSFRPEMFVSFRLFAALIGVCLILNILSALVPAWMSMRHSIVNSINNNRS